MNVIGMLKGQFAGPPEDLDSLVAQRDALSGKIMDKGDNEIQENTGLIMTYDLEIKSLKDRNEYIKEILRSL